MSERESPRVTALKEAVEKCRKAGLSESEIISITTAEVYGAARLRAAISECLAPSKHVRMSYYETVIDKQVTGEEILAVVAQVSKKEQMVQG